MFLKNIFERKKLLQKEKELAEEKNFYKELIETLLLPGVIENFDVDKFIRENDHNYINKWLHNQIELLLDVISFRKDYFAFKEKIIEADIEDATEKIFKEELLLRCLIKKSKIELFGYIGYN